MSRDMVRNSLSVGRAFCGFWGWSRVNPQICRRLLGAFGWLGPETPSEPPRGKKTPNDACLGAPIWIPISETGSTARPQTIRTWRRCNKISQLDVVETGACRSGSVDTLHGRRRSCYGAARPDDLPSVDKGRIWPIRRGAGTLQARPSTYVHPAHQSEADR